VSHPFRFGVIAVPRGTDEDWLATTHRVADRGYSTLLSPDGTGPVRVNAVVGAAVVLSGAVPRSALLAG
jgi:hypothetical protein